MTNQFEVIKIQAYSLRGLLLAVEEHVKKGYHFLHDRDAVNFISVYSCYMTKLDVPENTVKDWVIVDFTPIVVDKIEEDVVKIVPQDIKQTLSLPNAEATEKRKPGRPPLSKESTDV